jgi:hypothetical protein
MTHQMTRYLLKELLALVYRRSLIRTALARSASGDFYASR